MLQTFYNAYGFFGSILIAFSGFMFCIFWFAGIAGITQEPDSKSKTFKLVISVLIPLYPIVWLLYDMYYQRERMKEGEGI